jgi:bifunctional non-homologous end joining protein LigD
MIPPMLAKNASHLPSGKNFTYEIKLDGQRTLAEVKGKNLTLYTRSLQNVTSKYPELADLKKNLKTKNAILDGEIVALEDGIPSFQLLQQRMNLHDKKLIQAASIEIPIIYYVFDILECRGKSLLKLPLHERKKILKQTIVPSDNVKVLPCFESRDQILAKAQDFGYEGIVAKLRNSPYLPGARTDAWLKYKFQKEEVFLICGWLDGGRVRNFGALLLGKYHGRREYRYVGRAGTGFTDRMIHYLMQQLVSLETQAAPFPNAPRVKGAHWVRPSLKVRVKFREMTQAGVLRAPVFMGIEKNTR